METYRSGHNGTDSKSVVPHGTVGSNPTVSAIRKSSKRVGLLDFLFSEEFSKSTFMRLYIIGNLIQCITSFTLHNSTKSTYTVGMCSLYYYIGWGERIRTFGMLESESSALPLGDTPSNVLYYITLILKMQVFF
jgi:hypothetical protein